jgi:hypothetical protein
MTDPIELEGQWYEALKKGRPDLSEEALRIEAMKWAATGSAPIGATDVLHAAEDAFHLSYLDEGKLWLAYRVIQKKGLPVVKTWIAQFWNDPAYFAAACRGIIVMLCQLVVQGVIVVPWIPQAAWFAGVVMSGLAVGIPAGQSNPAPGTIKAIAQSPDLVVTSKDVKAADAAVEKAAK